VHAKYVGEFLQNQFLAETRDGVLQVIDRMHRDLDVQAIILGGTELPILLRADAHHGVELLDTTKIHAAAVLTAAA
jgi:aspartate racemase